MDQSRADQREKARMLGEMGCAQSLPVAMTGAEFSETDLETRVAKLRKTVLRTPSICLERGRLLTESYRETKRPPAPSSAGEGSGQDPR